MTAPRPPRPPRPPWPFRPPRPFRHLCPEADQRDLMSDSDFWAHVYRDVTGVDMAPEPDWDDMLPGAPDHVAPCGLCGESGACGYDTEGRPMIHAFYDDLDDDQ